MTAAVVAVLVWVAGGVGAGLRFMLDDVIRSRITAPTRWLRRWSTSPDPCSSAWSPVFSAATCSPTPDSVILGTGLLGGYTTFSTASFETVQLLGSRRYLTGIVYGLGTVAVAGLAAALCYLLGVSF